MNNIKRRLNDDGVTVITKTSNENNLIKKSSTIKETEPTDIPANTNWGCVPIPTFSSIFKQQAPITKIIKIHENNISVLQKRKQYLETKLYMYNRINDEKMEEVIDKIAETSSSDDDVVARVFKENHQKKEAQERQLYKDGKNNIIYIYNNQFILCVLSSLDLLLVFSNIYTDISELEDVRNAKYIYMKYKDEFIRKMVRYINDKKMYCISLANEYIRVEREYLKRETELDKYTYSYGFKYDHSQQVMPTPSRSMRVTRYHSQTSILDLDSITSTDSAYFIDKQGEPPNQIVYNRWKFINKSNNFLTTDNQPQKCLGQPDAIPCPPTCNCVYNIQKSQYLYKPWSYLEQFIFIDLFFQKPKNFHFIAQHLKNRNTNEVIDFYYRMKKGLHIPLLLRVYISLKRAKNGDQRPIVLAAAYAIGLPIPESVFTPDYASVNIYEYISEYQYNHPESPYIQQPLPFSYDGEEMSPEERRRRRQAREHEIEHLLEKMGIDLKGCIPPSESLTQGSGRGRRGIQRAKEQHRIHEEETN
ncbi:hypothetical protein WA158_002150 [Blastocystis sp. Blastoise]